MLARDPFFHLAGYGFLALAKLKYSLSGYTTPKPFPINETDRAIDYAINTSTRLQTFHQQYAHDSIRGKRVLELGPGSDLGIGLHQIASGADYYCGFDIHELATKVPESHYQKFAARENVDLAALSDGRIEYIINEQFDLAVLPANSFDVVFSNAAFEHFDDVYATIDQVKTLLRPGGTFIAEVDLQTHSRWIRERDPNNIYRYSERLYKAFHFPAQPNRVRPERYVEHLKTSGWKTVQNAPQNQLPNAMHKRRVSKGFRGSDMTTLSTVIMATSPGSTD